VQRDPSDELEAALQPKPGLALHGLHTAEVNPGLNVPIGQAAPDDSVEPPSHA
jgi:hypothetical protein